MDWIKKTITALILLFVSMTTFAQEEVAMADKLREDGGIYVVLVTVLIILFGLFAYLMFLGKRIKEMEETINK